MKSNQGQSLIEMVVAVAVVILVVLTLVVATTISIRNAAFSRNQSLATKYAQEGIEKVRAYRDQSIWETFTVACDGKTISLNSPPSPFLLSFDCAGSGNSREVTINVSWTDAQGTHQSELTTRLTNWK